MGLQLVHNAAINQKKEKKNVSIHSLEITPSAKWNKVRFLSCELPPSLVNRQ